MKRIFVFRHGKSDWSAGAGADRERPLAPRGRRAAATVGVFVARLDQVPDLVLASPAVRARDTARLAAEAGGWECPLREAPELYLEGPPGILELVRRQDDGTASLLLAGHQPACSELVTHLTGGGSVKFPTAALARIDLPVEAWRQAGPGRGVLAWLITPKLLLRGDPKG